MQLNGGVAVSSCKASGPSRKSQMARRLLRPSPGRLAPVIAVTTVPTHARFPSIATHMTGAFSTHFPVYVDLDVSNRNDRNKLVLGDAVDSGMNQRREIAGSWGSTAQITQAEFYMDSGNPMFGIGTTLTVYGSSD